MNRRQFVAAGLSAVAWPGLAYSQDTRRSSSQTLTKIALVGQALIEHSMPSPDVWPGRNAIAERLKNAHIRFTNFESVIKGPRAGAPTRDLLTLHAAAPEVLDTLKSVHINLMATSNNHAFDLGTGGILDTMDAIRAAGIPFAGTGLNVSEAAAPAVVKGDHAPMALVAFATGKIRDGGMATDTRPGVNELRRGAMGNVVEEDAQRILESIRLAKKSASIVMAYHHNHDWEPEQVQVPSWQRAFAKRCIDQGASLWVGHGVPMLQGIEVYNGVPLFYGLGSFIFQTEKAIGAYGPESWQSAIVECSFEGGNCVSAGLTPIVLNEVGLSGPDDMVTRGAPALAIGVKARAILDHIMALSNPFGTRLAINLTGEIAELDI